MHSSVCLIHSLYSEAVQNPYQKNYATCGRTEQYSEHNNSPNYAQVNLYIKFKILKTIDIYLQLTNFTISSSSIKIFLHFPINFQAYQTRSNTSLPCLCNPDRFCFHSKKKKTVYFFQTSISALERADAPFSILWLNMALFCVELCVHFLPARYSLKFSILIRPVNYPHKRLSHKLKVSRDFLALFQNVPF